MVQTHERYLHSIEDETNYDTEDLWLNPSQVTYDQAERSYFMWIKTQESKQHEQSMHVQKQESLQNVKSSNLKCVRKMEEITFSGLLQTFNELTVAENTDFEVVECLHHDVKEQFERCKIANIEYISSLESENIDNEISWFSSLQEHYINAMKAFGKLTESNEKQRAVNSNRAPQYKLKLEPMKLPKFQGSIRDYATFKYDFQTYVFRPFSQGRIINSFRRYMTRCSQYVI